MFHNNCISVYKISRVFRKIEYEGNMSFSGGHIYKSGNLKKKNLKIFTGTWSFCKKNNVIIQNVGAQAVIN